MRAALLCDIGRAARKKNPSAVKARCRSQRSSLDAIVMTMLTPALASVVVGLLDATATDDSVGAVMSIVTDDESVVLLTVVPGMPFAPANAMEKFIGLEMPLSLFVSVTLALQLVPLALPVTLTLLPPTVTTNPLGDSTLLEVKITVTAWPALAVRGLMLLLDAMLTAGSVAAAATLFVTSIALKLWIFEELEVLFLLYATVTFEPSRMLAASTSTTVLLAPEVGMGAMDAMVALDALPTCDVTTTAKSPFAGGV